MNPDDLPSEKPACLQTEGYGHALLHAPREYIGSENAYTKVLSVTDNCLTACIVAYRGFCRSAEIPGRIGICLHNTWSDFIAGKFEEV